MKLEWQERFDEHDNSIWEASAPCAPGEDEIPFEFRLNQFLIRNEVVWQDASDEDIRLGGHWNDIAKAKIDMGKRANEMLKPSVAAKEAVDPKSFTYHLPDEAYRLKTEELIIQIMPIAESLIDICQEWGCDHMNIGGDLADIKLTKGTFHP